ncbi:hypothetical protein L917_06472, partial [Phytophthora nicotianae]
ALELSRCSFSSKSGGRDSFLACAQKLASERRRHDRQRQARQHRISNVERGKPHYYDGVAKCNAANGDFIRLAVASTLHHEVFSMRLYRLVLARYKKSGGSRLHIP